LHHVLIIHAVRDYGAWTTVLDAAASLRRDAGERSFQVLRDASDPNKVVHFSRWGSVARAKACIESPAFLYLHQLEAGTL
jgi:quinol monooxygenase YgiN